MTFWQVVSWATMITCVVAFFLNVKKRKMCFILWEIGAVSFILVNIFWTHDLAQASLNFMYLFFNAYGWFQWRKEEYTSK
jgi:hypothetical protein